jgi:hypothetical protein
VEWSWQCEGATGTVTVLPGWAGGQGGVGGTELGCLASGGAGRPLQGAAVPRTRSRVCHHYRCGCASGEGRWVAGTAALCSQSEAGVALGSSPPTGPHPEGSWGWWPAAGMGQCPAPLPKTPPPLLKRRANLPGTDRAKVGVSLSPPESV